MSEINTVKLSKIVDELKLRIINRSSDYENRVIKSRNVNRPGLQLTGYMDGFQNERIQIIGRTEYQYYMSLDPETRYERFRGIFSQDIPALIYTYDMEITQDIIDLANYYDKTLLISNLSTTRLIAKLNFALERFLAEAKTVHAGLLEVYGSGVLIVGNSSVGKSETGLDLVIKGHRLVADDVVEIKKIDQKLIGQAPENIRHFMEIRGLGILDIRRLYGTGSVKTQTNIDLVVRLENWNEDVEYDRLGIDETFTEILGIKVPLIVIPVKPGRNITMIIEVATMNNRERRLGYNAAVELNKRLIESANKENERRRLEEEKNNNDF